MAQTKALVLQDVDSSHRLRFESFREFAEWLREQGDDGELELTPEDAKALALWALDNSPPFESFQDFSVSLAAEMRRCEQWQGVVLKAPLQDQAESTACLVFVRRLNQTDSWAEWMDRLETALVLRSKSQASVNGRIFLSWHRAAVYVSSQSMFRFLLTVNHAVGFLPFLSEPDDTATRPDVVERIQERIAGLKSRVASGLTETWSLDKEIDVDWQSLHAGLQGERLLFEGTCGTVEANGRRIAAIGGLDGSQTSDGSPEQATQVAPDDTRVGDLARSPIPVRPPPNAFRAWFTRDVLGVATQQAIAAEMTQHGCPASQGQVSKWLRAVDEYRKAGGIMPTLADLNRPDVDTVDPDIIDMGARQDATTPRQRLRRDADTDSWSE
jgi:hypothetical protein